MLSMAGSGLSHTCEDAPLPFQSLSDDGTILEVNHAWEKLSGYSADEAVGMDYRALVPPEHAKDFADNLAQMRATGELVGADCFLLQKDGGIRNVLIFGRRDTSSDSFNCQLVDISDFRGTERALIESEQRFRSLFALAPTPIVIHDGERILMANQACAEFLGYDSPEELMGAPVVSLVAPEDRAQVGERVHRMLTEGWSAPSTEERFIRKDGTYAFGSTLASPVVLDGRKAIHVVALDLSETHRAQERLAESEQRFRDLFEFSADPIIVHDGKVPLFANRAALNRFGLPLGVDPTAYSIEDFICDDSMPLVRERIIALLGGQKFDTPIEVHLRDKAGEEWYAEAKSAPIVMNGRRILQTTFHDLTERRRSEAELAEYRERLEALLAERTETLQRVRKELESVTSVVSRTVEMRDPYTAGHQRRVATLALAIAEKLGMDAAAIEQLEVAARLHDVGKVGIPAELLSKPARLTQIEYALVQTHVDAGYDIVSSAEFEGDVATIVRQHHERLDGSGYPLGLTSADLLPESKVLMVADVVEAMSSHRPYRPSLGEGAALAEIVDGRGVRYDEAAVDACMALMRAGFDFGEPDYL